MVCYRIVEPVLPEQVKAFMERVFEKKEPIQELPVCTAVRWIPCTSVGTTQLLPAFVPEKLECFDGGKWKRAREVMVALTRTAWEGIMRPCSIPVFATIRQLFRRRRKRWRCGD